MADDPKKSPSLAARGFEAIRVVLEGIHAKAAKSDDRVADLERRLVYLEKMADVQ